MMQPQLVVPWSVPWRPRDVAMAFVSVVAVWVATFFVAGLVEAAGRLSQPLLMLLIAVAEGSLLLAVWWFGLRRRGGSLNHLGFKALPSAAGYLLPVAVVFLSLTFTAVYYQMVKALGVDVLLPPPLPEPLRPGAEARWAPFLLAVVLAPVAEECFFRGFLIPPLAQRWGFRLAVVVSGLSFAVFHGAVAVMMPIFVIGLMLALLYRKTGSLWSCIIAHSGYNAAVFALGS